MPTLTETPDRLQAAIDELGQSQLPALPALLQFVRAATPVLVDMTTCPGASSPIDDLAAASWLGAQDSHQLARCRSSILACTGLRLAQMLEGDTPTSPELPVWALLDAWTSDSAHLTA